MRRLCADREEKRVTRGSDISGQHGEQEQLDLNDPNQRSLLGSVLDKDSSARRAVSAGDIFAVTALAFLFAS